MQWKHYSRPHRRSHKKKPKITIHKDHESRKHHKRPITLQDADGTGKFLHLHYLKPEDAGLYAVVANFNDNTSMISRQVWVVVKPFGIFLNINMSDKQFNTRY